MADLSCCRVFPKAALKLVSEQEAQRMRGRGIPEPEQKFASLKSEKSDDLLGF